MHVCPECVAGSQSLGKCNKYKYNISSGTMGTGYKGKLSKYRNILLGSVLALAIAGSSYLGYNYMREKPPEYTSPVYETPTTPSEAAPLPGFELVRAYLPDRWPDWAPELVRGKYADGKITIDEQELSVTMQEWVDNESRIVERLSIEDVASIDRFINFDLPASGPSGVPPEVKRAKGQEIIWNTEVYHLLFTEFQLAR